ncbi:MAG TPA: TRAP transporter small permease [Burkholderiaceae bacterium]|nr:TRAP transporter small permease [Burkholderiaceae bacterium]
MLERLLRGISRILEVTIVACLAVMSLLVFGNVVLRYLFNSGIAWSEELSRLVFVWLIFLGAILASREHAHIGFDTLVRRLPDFWKKLCIAVTGVAMLVFCGFFIVGGWQQTVINLDNQYPVLGVSYAWLYAVAIVFGIGTAASILYNLWIALLRRPSAEELELVRNLGQRIEGKLDSVAMRNKGEATE